MFPPIFIAFLHILAIGLVAADSGDDFSNNLFADLGPQSMGWSECIILATAPLGIITIIVAAIRVGGPSWLKALIGRATENIASAELELMSSTSKEVCELWNGKDVVRCAGSAPICEFICLVPSEGMPENPAVRVLEIEEASLYIKKSCGRTAFGPKNEVIVVRNTRHAAPNISHNRSKNIGRGELYLTACCGIILQVGVLVYCSFITQYSKITARFQKIGQPVGRYAFPLTLVGTVFLNIGILICSHVVESSTNEEIFKPMEGWQARLVWLQQEKMVGDQEFKSFALFTREDQPRVVSSSRVDRHQTTKVNEPNKGSREQSDESVVNNEDNEISAWSASVNPEIKTVIGTVISLIGFFAQFIGIRVLIMTAMRAWVRRGLTTPIISEPLLPGFELDWFADTFRDLKNAKCSSFGTSASINRKDDARPKKFDVIRRYLAKLAGWRSLVSQEAIAVTKAIEATMNILHAQYSWEYRIRIGEQEEQLLRFHIQKRGHKWKANVGEIETALSLSLFYLKSLERQTGSMTKIANSLSGPSDDGWPRVQGNVADFGIRWWIPADGPRVLTITNMKLITSHCNKINTSRSKQVEAVESAYSGSGAHETIEIQDSRVFGFGIRNQQDDMIMSPVIHNFNLSTLKTQSGNSTCLLAVDFQDSLEVLHAKDLFSTFIWARIKSLKHPIRGKTDVLAQVAEGRGSWKNFSLYNNTISRLSQAIQGSGLYSTNDALISVISPLCIQQKLPEVRGIVYLARIRANEFERLQKWESASKVYMWLSDRIDSFGVESYSYVEAIAVLAAFLNGVRDEIERRQSEQVDDTQLILQNISEEFSQRMNSALYEFQDKNGRQKYAKDFSINISSQDQKSLFTSAKIFKEEFLSRLRDPTEQEWTSEVAKAEDVFYRTLLHYFATFTYDSNGHVNTEKLGTISGSTQKDAIILFQATIRSFVDVSAKIDGGDIRGWTPLHYACWVGNTWMARLLLEKGASVNAQSHDGTAPIHCAAREGHLETIEILLEFRAAIDAMDGGGKTALHLAALNGHSETIKLLRQRGCRKVLDKWGRTALHLAAIAGEAVVIDPLLAGDANSIDSKSRTPLHLAAHCGQNSFVQQLLTIPQIEKLALDALGQAPIHLAAEAGHAYVIHILARSGVNVDIQNRDGRTPLHLACHEGHYNVVKALLDAGATIDAVTEDQETPLHYAVRAQKERIVKLLTSRNSNVGSVTRRGNTTLDLALQTGNAAVVQCLVEHGADVNRGAQTEPGTALHLASCLSDNLQVMVLIGLGADVNTADSNGSTPLHSAAQLRGFAGIIHELLQAGARIDQKDEDGRTPLHLAAKRNV
ncbi:ankyrin repeat-containing domain protein [Trichoderma asperelloides]|nr:ankyrin repeat-containing domain protein [Trichoderma asperelloides]